MDEYLLYCIDRLQRIVDGSGYYFDSAMPMVLSEMSLNLIEDMDTSTYRMLGTKEQIEWWDKQLDFRKRFQGCDWMKPPILPEIPKELMDESGGWKYPPPSHFYQSNYNARLRIIGGENAASKP